MHFRKDFVRAAAYLLLGAQCVVASTGGKVILINATPYDWKQVATHQYQMDWKFPDVIPAGTIREQYVEFIYNGDDAAETTFTLVGNPTHASFTVQARQPKRIQIQYHESLSSLNNPRETLIDLGFNHDGAVLFILAGSGTGGSPFISTNPPVAWMQSTLSAIGSRTLREIAMPASHDAGMSQLTLWDGGVPHNTLTQSGNVYQQLVYGARCFDIRPVYSHGKFYTGHYSKIMASQAGGSGRSIDDIVKDINRFTSENPGELIILDLSHDMNRDKNYRSLAPTEWQKLFNFLKGINDLWGGSNKLPEDLSTVPISAFITPGSKSAVLIRVPDRAPLPGNGFSTRDLGSRDGVNSTPGANSDDDGDSSSSIDLAPPLTTANTTSTTTTPLPHLPTLSKLPHTTTLLTVMPTPTPSGYPASAFIYDYRLPYTGSYSNTNDAKYLATDQLSKLANLRSSPQNYPMRSTWTITQRFGHIIDVATAATSIIGDAIAAHSVLFSRLWSSCSKATYPNLIEVDDIHNSQITSLAMGINEYFANRVVDLPKVRKRECSRFGIHTLEKRGREFLSKISCLSDWGCSNFQEKFKIDASTHVLETRNPRFWGKVSCFPGWGCNNFQGKSNATARPINIGTHEAARKRKQSFWSKALCSINILIGCSGGKDEHFDPFQAIANILEIPARTSDRACFILFKMPKSCFSPGKKEIEAQEKEAKMNEETRKREGGRSGRRIGIGSLVSGRMPR
jgi:hypothetical protein